MVARGYCNTVEYRQILSRDRRTQNSSRAQMVICQHINPFPSWPAIVFSSHKPFYSQPNYPSWYFGAYFELQFASPDVNKFKGVAETVKWPIFPDLNIITVAIGISDFRVAFPLSSKASPSAKPFI